MTSWHELYASTVDESADLANFSSTVSRVYIENKSHFQGSAPPLS